LSQIHLLGSLWYEQQGTWRGMEEILRDICEIEGGGSSEKISSAKNSSSGVEELFSQYKMIADSHPLNDKKIVKGIQILLQIFSTGRIDWKFLATSINKILQKLT
jgi:hypothetical protein